MLPRLVTLRRRRVTRLLYLKYPYVVIFRCRISLDGDANNYLEVDTEMVVIYYGLFTAECYGHEVSYSMRVITMHSIGYHTIIECFNHHSPKASWEPQPTAVAHPYRLAAPPAVEPAPPPFMSSLPRPTRHAPSTVVSHSSTRALSRARSRSCRIAFARCSTSARVSRLVLAGFDAFVNASSELSAFSCEVAEGAWGERETEGPGPSGVARLCGSDGATSGSV